MNSLNVKMPITASVQDDSEDIVITGVSGQYPNCKNVQEFEYNLYNKINMVDDHEVRWVHKYPGIPKVQGKIPHPSKFDATFFGIHQGQADNMDVQMRIIIEEAYKAIMDAGVNPVTLRNSNTGVYIGACASEADIFLMYCENTNNGFGLLGSSKSLLANRISFVLGLNGPSLACDTACSSSMYALHIAYEHMKNGSIDAAIVGGANFLICPYVTAKFAKLGILSLSGNCRPLDDDANGYIRSEAITCIFLQRRGNAKRIYATLVKSAINCDGFKAEGLTYPSANMQKQLLEKFYHEADIDLNELGYMEAHSTGTVAGDPEECRGIDEAICKKRNKPLLIGTVKSNCGHAEGASGVVSITKALLTLNNNCIPPNINFKMPRKTIDGLINKRLTVVTERTVLQAPYVCVNSFGFGGANAHALLKQETTERSVPLYGSPNDLPYLFTWLSRSETNTNTVFEYIEARPLSLEHLSLMRSSQIGGIKGMVYRGYNILKPSCNTQVSKPISLSKEVQYNEGIKIPITWVFSGMGSQWVGMGKDLMKIKICSESILKCHALLKPKGLDLIDILTSENPDTYQNILYSFVGITSIQIALVDLLQTLEIKPDYIIGHSLGEVACAYADGCLTAEQTLLCSYYRGTICISMETIRGSMAAIGLSFKDIQPMLPTTIDAACHNSNESCTISGPVDDVSIFVDEMKSKKIFAKEVPCSNIAFHSRYIKHFGPELLKLMRQVIPNPTLRSNRWISSSFPSEKWQLNESKFCTPEYQIHNLLSSVLFEENTTYLPKNSLTIEIAPHCLLQSILKSCNPDGTHVGLTRRNAKDNVIHLLESLGKLYVHGCELRLDKLYPPIQWPVNRGTPTISNLIELDNSKDYAVPRFEDECTKTGNKVVNILTTSEHKYLLGHEIDGRSLVPATFYIESVWKAFALTHGILDFETVDVEFENVRFLRATTLSTKDEINLQISIQQGTGSFEITESKTLIASGIIRKLSEKTKPPSVISGTEKYKGEVLLSKKDFYKELKLRGYHYKGDFQSVELALGGGSYGKIKWFNNWVTFMDCMLQLSIVRADSRNLALPVKLRTMRIVSSYHKRRFLNNCDIEAYAKGDRIVAGGIEIIDLKTNHIQRRKPPSEPVLEKYQFIPYYNTSKLSPYDISKCCLQLYLENYPVSKCTAVHAATSAPADLMFLNGLMQAFNDLPLIQGNYIFLNLNQEDNLKKSFDSCEATSIKYADSVDELECSMDILLLDEENFASNLLTLKPRLSQQSMVLIKISDRNCFEKFSSQKEFIPIGLFSCLNRTFSILVLLKKSCLEQPKHPQKETFITISHREDFQWIDELKAAIGKRIVLVADKEPHNGIIGFINCLRKEAETSQVRCIFIDDDCAPKFDPNLPFYSNQLKLGLAINIYRQGQWGTYRHIQLNPTYPVAEHTDHICGAIGNIGDFSTLHWQKGRINKNDAKIRITYSALNFRDVMHASGRLSAEDIGLTRLEQSFIFGLEYSGIDEKSGKAVMGMALHSAVASHIEHNSIISWEVPSQWTLREAATIPVVYTTVYYAFFYMADIRSGKSILIHSGSGGVGIAAIRTAIAYGLEVYTTVSTIEKKKFLLRTFPQLKEENIGNSRDCSFEEMIRNRTNSRGVDFVLNSLSEDKLKASLRCLAPNGNFLEIGKFDMANDSAIGLGVFFQGQRFYAVLADKLKEYSPHLIEKIKLHIAEDIHKGIVQPLPCTIFKPTELEQAFRYLMTAKHIGKVLIELRSDAKAATHPVSAAPRVYFSKDLVYVVPGGLGGFGLELVDWMVLRGARKIVINSRRGLSEEYQKHRISIWNSYSCQICINTSDITSEGGCLELLNESMKLGSIGGIFNLAVLLKDGVFSNQAVESFQQCLAPKSTATKYLDKLSRKLCPKLHYFVVFSSIACGRGNAGQSNYGMANSMMERIVEERLKLGYPGKAIQWGAVGEVGLAAAMVGEKIDSNIGGTLQQRITSCLNALDTLLTSPDPIVASMVVGEKKISAGSQTALQFVLNTLSLTQLKSVSVNSTLSELGMDSLMGVEIKQTLERNFDIVLTPAELRSLTIDRLKELSDVHKKKSAECQGDDKESYIPNFLEVLYLNVTYKPVNTEILLPLNNLNSNQVPIIIFPGVESVCSQRWEEIGCQLNVPAYCVQLSAKVGTESFNSLMKIIVNEISKLLNSRRKKTFNIVAHSFGTLVAHIVAKHLENLGFSGSMVYIDGSPAWIENMCKEIKASDVLEVKKKIVLLALKSLGNDEQMDNFRKIVNENQNLEAIYWNIKQNLNSRDVDECMHFLNAVMAITETVLDTNTYKLVDIIESKIRIIKPTTLVKPTSTIDEYYGLKPITRNIIDLTSLEGDHHTILVNKQVPEVLRNYFGIKDIV